MAGSGQQGVTKAIRAAGHTSSIRAERSARGKREGGVRDSEKTVGSKQRAASEQAARESNLVQKGDAIYPTSAPHGGNVVSR